MTEVARRSRRFHRRQQRFRRRPLLNLVAMMDVFTILVFFLLVNYSDGMLSADRNTLRLPEALAEQKPRDTIIVTLTSRDILVEGRRVAQVHSVLRLADDEIAPLRSALQERMRDEPSFSQSPDGILREVTIMGDKAIPFRLLKKVMVTCTRAGYERISLSVLQRSLQSG